MVLVLFGYHLDFFVFKKKIWIPWSEFMQIGAANCPQMMQIGHGIMTKLCKSAPILERGQIYAIQKGAKR